MPWTIYCHTHVESGRRYVGMTARSMERRWSQHVTQSRVTKNGRWHFPNAIRKYGPDAFSHEILEVCHDLEVANLAEECWIELLETRNPEKGFNLAKGGQHTPHPVQKLGNRPEFVEKCRANSAHLLTPEGRAKSRAAVRTPEFRMKIGAIMKEIALRPGAKEKRAAASKEVTSRPEVLAKISAAARRKKTHCKYGHSLEDAKERRSGGRVCRVCANLRCKLSRRKRNGPPKRREHELPSVSQGRPGASG